MHTTIPSRPFFGWSNFSDQIDIIVDDICVSYVIVTTYGGEAWAMWVVLVRMSL